MHKNGKALVIGGIALDEISLPTTHLKDIVGGSAIYGSFSSALFSPTYIGGIVGADFPESFINKMKAKNIDLRFLQHSKKPSFRWSGKYSQDLAHITNLNVSEGAFADFLVPEFGIDRETITAAFIANNDPASQIEIMNELDPKTIKILDSMDVWLLDKRDVLLQAINMTDVLLVNEAEAKLMFRGVNSIPELIERIMRLGPKVVIYKRGEHGLVMYGRLGTMVVPSYPLAYAIDPSGAGDVLGGAIAGVLAKFGNLDEQSMKTAVLLASIASSFVVEDYATDGITNVTLKEVLNRGHNFLQTLPQRDDISFSLFD